MKRRIVALILITACVLSQAVICFSEESGALSYRMEIDILENKINALNSSLSDMSSNLQNTVNEIEENTWGNKIRKTINQQ